MTQANSRETLEVMPGEHESHPKHNLTGFIIFLCSESVIFLAFFSGYAILKLNALDWYPPGVEGLEISKPLINTVVLVSSSGTIALAEHFKARENMALFRGFWFLSMLSVRKKASTGLLKEFFSPSPRFSPRIT